MSKEIKEITQHHTLTIWIPAGTTLNELVYILSEHRYENVDWVVPIDTDIVIANETKEQLEEKIGEKL